MVRITPVFKQFWVLLKRFIIIKINQTRSFTILVLVKKVLYFCCKYVKNVELFFWNSQENFNSWSLCSILPPVMYCTQAALFLLVSQKLWKILYTLCLILIKNTHTVLYAYTTVDIHKFNNIILGPLNSLCPHALDSFFNTALLNAHDCIR